MVAPWAVEVSGQLWGLLAGSQGTDCKQNSGYGRKILSWVWHGVLCLSLNGKHSRGFCLHVPLPTHSPLSASGHCGGTEHSCLFWGRRRVRTIPDPLLPSAVCMVINLSLPDKPTAQQSSDSEAEQCPIIPVVGARGYSLTRGLHVPGQMAPQTPLIVPVTLLGEFDMCQQFWLSAFMSYQQRCCLKYWEKLRVHPGQCHPWLVLSQGWWLQGNMDVHMWSEILQPQLCDLYLSGLVTCWRC